MQCRSARTLLFAWLAVLAGFLPAHAQDIQNFRAAPGTQNYLSVDGARVPRHGEVIPSVLLHYGNQPLVVREEGGGVRESIVEHLATADLMLSLGLYERFDLAMAAPVHYVTGDRVKDADQDGVALGDVRLLPKVRLLGSRKGTGFGAAIALPVSFPSGTPDAYVGSESISANPKLILEARITGVTLAANGGVRLRSGAKIGNLDLGHEATYAAALGVPLGTDSLVAMGEVFGAAPIEEVSGDAATTPLEAAAGLRWFLESGPVFTVGMGTGIIGDYGTPAARFMAGFAWHDRRYDEDHDGILDEIDQCPLEPEDRDNFQDADGCPDTDNDQDGVPDDTDVCVNDPEDRDGWEDSDGCVEPDNDLDGLLDEEDRCPNDPENFNNWEDGDGCPDEIPDTDGDGFLDPDDLCPQQPEDRDGFEDDDGCPDPDNDGDGVLDTTDQCPLEPEVINGYQDEDGCPDQGETKVRVTREKIEIDDKIYFESNRAIIKPISYSILNQLAAVLKAHPYIILVRIEGHTDDRGAARHNAKLSQARADAVREYIVAQGIEASRLESIGHGEERPIASNRNARGRAANRRVEFTIQNQTLEDEVEILEEGFEILPPGSDQRPPDAPPSESPDPASAPPPPASDAPPADPAP